MSEKKKAEQKVDLTRHHLSNPRTQLWLGSLAATHLNAVGTVTLFLGEDGKVRVANPLHVYLDGPAMMGDEDFGKRSFRWVRPVVGEAKPQYAAWKDGTLWEVEFTDEQPNSSEEGD